MNLLCRLLFWHLVVVPLGEGKGHSSAEAPPGLGYGGGLRLSKS